jgi:putative FmdB family regulatory protein
MPTYVYECAKCNDEFELWQSFADDPLKRHPGCGGKVTKVLQPVGIVLKGSGFYKTDSRSGSKRGGEKAAKSETASGNGNSGSSTKSDTTKSSDKSSTAAAKGT